MLHGIDVSRHQGSIDWQRLAPHVDEVLIRSTMGAVGVDDAYARNWRESGWAGIKRRGIYHLVTSRTPWRGQLDNLRRVTKGDYGSVGVTLDVERTSADRADTRPFPRQPYTDDLLELAFALKREAPAVYIYSNASEIQAMTTQPPALNLFGFHGAGYPLREPMSFERLAALWPGYRLVIPRPWTAAHLRAWQGASTGRLPGIAGDVDLSLVFETVPPPAGDDDRRQVAEHVRAALAWLEA